MKKLYILEMTEETDYEIREVNFGAFRTEVQAKQKGKQLVYSSKNDFTDYYVGDIDFYE